MANPFIYALTDPRWSAAGTTYQAIWMDLNNGASGTAVGAAASRPLRLSNNGTDFFGVSLTGVISAVSGAITTSQPHTFTQTVNAGAVVFNSFLVNTTLIAAAAGSTVADFQVGGVSALSVLLAAPSSSVPVVSIGRGGVSTQQLQFVPNSGTGVSFGMANGGSALLVFNGANKVLDFDDVGITLTANGAFRWSNSATVPNTTIDTGINRNAAGIVEINNGTQTTYRDLKLRNLFSNFGTAIPAGGTAGAGIMMSSTTNLGIFFGSGAPTLSAAQGSLYIRSDGSTIATRFYVNTDGGTTWTNFVTAA